MKRLLYILGFIAIMGCNENTCITEEIEVENPSSDCYRIIAISSYDYSCGKILSIRVHRFDLYPNDPASEVICITKEGFSINDFYLGEAICDLSIYN